MHDPSHNFFSLPPCGYRWTCLLLSVVAWLMGCGQIALADGEEPAAVQADAELRVAIHSLAAANTGQPMMTVPGFAPPTNAADELTDYQRTRLGRWLIPEEMAGDDTVVELVINTPNGPLRVRCDIWIDDQPYRETRDALIDQILREAKAEPTNVAEQPVDVPDDASEVVDDQPELAPGMMATQAYLPASSFHRLVAYARTRGDRLTRQELRHRLAEVAAGPALIMTEHDFGSQRSDLVSLFALLDVDGDQVISAEERAAAVALLRNQDLNSDRKLELTELRQGLRDRSPRRDVWSSDKLWKTWTPSDSAGSEQPPAASLQVSFGGDADDAGLALASDLPSAAWSASIASLVTPVTQAKANTKQKVILLSGSKTRLAFYAIEPADLPDETSPRRSQVSIGVVCDGHALLKKVDRDGDWIVTESEYRSIADVIAGLDANADGALHASELPAQIRVCIARGPLAHVALRDDVSIVSRTRETESATASAPAWFVSMDQDGDKVLTRNEFLGGGPQFDAMDLNQDDRLSIAEVTQAQSTSE